MKSIHLLLIFFLLLFSGCKTVPSKPKILSELPPKEDRYCLVFVIDGLGGPIAKKWIKEGKLPNIKKHIFDRGLWVDEATSIFPSVTAAAMTSLMTGTYPGRHDIVNFQWINRESGQYKCYIGTDISEFTKDLNPEVKTIFQYFPKEETASFGFLIDKGAGHKDGLIYSALNPFRGLAPQTHVALTEFFSLFAVGNGIPRLMAVYDWNVDDRGHRFGAEAKETFNVLKQADQFFGNLVKLYEERGIYDQTYFVLISDHGLAPVKKRLYVDHLLKDHGFKVKRISWNLGESHFPQDWDRIDSLLWTTKKIYGHDVIVGAAGGGCATIDLVKNAGVPFNQGEVEADVWPEQLTYSDVRNYKIRSGESIDLIDLFSKEKGIDFILVRDDLNDVEGKRIVRVISARGELQMTRVQGPDQDYYYQYKVLKGKDPLSLADEHQVRPYVETERFYEGRLWYEVLRGEDYPDAVVQLCQIFDSPRAPTLLLSAAKNWSFNSIIKAKHAGPLEEEMKATLMFAGPGIQKEKKAQARIVDMVPTVLELMGAEYDQEKLDGQPIQF